jgi:hypothetical protein
VGRSGVRDNLDVVGIGGWLILKWILET